MTLELFSQIPQNIEVETDPEPLSNADQLELTLYVSAAVIIFIIAMVWFWWRRKQLSEDE